MEKECIEAAKEAFQRVERRLVDLERNAEGDDVLSELYRIKAFIELVDLERRKGDK